MGYFSLFCFHLLFEKLRNNLQVLIPPKYGNAYLALSKKVIYSYKKPIKEKSGFLVLRSNFFDTAIMKMSVISKEFKERYLLNKKNPMEFTSRAIVFEGPEHYHKEINSNNNSMWHLCREEK